MIGRGSNGILAAALLCAAPAWATQLIGLDLDALAAGSDAIVQAKVVRVESHWTRDNLRIITEVELAVAESLKGSAATRVTVLQPGGVVGDIGQVVSGLARFEVGDEVVVFLERRGNDHFAVTGMAQGKFRVERSTDGKAAFAVPEETDALLIDPLTRKPMRSPLRPVELGEFKRQIRESLRRGQGTP